MATVEPIELFGIRLVGAALAAEEGNWQRSQQLMQEATSTLQSIEQTAKTPEASELAGIVDELEQLNQQMRGGDERPTPQQIRAIAKRTRDLGA